MEALLQLMLKWDPVQRGGRVNSDTKKPLCFEVLEQILSMKASYVCKDEAFRQSVWVSQHKYISLGTA